ncbi:MAG: hypothetical protein HFG28_04195 [Eubacterium sp.]|nr:hypothetical protein [Eubacterium sp.]
MRKEEEDKKRKFSYNRILKNIIPISELLSGAGCFLVKQELPRKVFMIMIIAFILWIICIAIDIICTIHRLGLKYCDDKKKLYNEAKRDKSTRSEYSYNKDTLRNDYIDAIVKFVKRKILKVLIATFIIFFLWFNNPNNANALGTGVKIFVNHVQNQSISIKDESDAEKENHSEEQDGLDNVGVIEGNVEKREKKVPGYRFILEDPNKLFKLESNVEAQVFFYDFNGKNISSKLIKLYFSNFHESKKIGIDIDDIEDWHGHTFRTYTEQEDQFKKRVAETVTEEYLDDWNEVAPRSSEMDKYIQGRDRLNAVIKEEEQGCYELWWRLANDYQYYAQEYEMQTENETAIVYYYSMSIYCGMEALKYEMDEKMFNKIYNYIVFRYKDLGRKETSIRDKYKLRAQQIDTILESKE